VHKDIGIKTVIGYALDGFPITGPVVAPGKFLTTGNLDECHGITSEILEDAKPKLTYHYVMTQDFPYSVSCFRGKPTRIGPSNPPPRQGMMGQDRQQQNMMGGMQGQESPQGGPRRPPPESLAACNGATDGATCSFNSPHGDAIRGTCHAPPGRPLGCVPSFRP
jgi:hypothetical protein